MIRNTLSIAPKGFPQRPASGGRHPLSRQRGFSIVELMMSVMLMAIGAALALPSYRDMVEKRQITNGAEQMAAFINTAQGVAMKTNRLVTVSYTRVGNDEWCIGAVSGGNACDCTVAYTDPPAANYCQIASQPFVLDNSHAADRELVYSISGAGAYAFDPVRGLASADNPLTMELRSPSEAFRLNLVVNRTGRVILCSASASHAVPGYAVCAAEPEEEVVES